MIEQWAAALEATQLAAGLRNSVWAYPLINAGHILGVALLVGSAAPLDLRLLGFWQTVPFAPLWSLLARTAAAGLCIAAICGLLLFAARASEYVSSNLFIANMMLVAVGVANALWLRFNHDGLQNGGEPSLRLRLGAAVSLFVWLGALVLGRLVGYF